MTDHTPGAFKLECPLCFRQFESLRKLKGHWMIEHPEAYSQKVLALQEAARRWTARFGKTLLGNRDGNRFEKR